MNSLKTWMKENHLTAIALSQRSGITRATINRLEEGAVPSLYTALRLQAISNGELWSEARGIPELTSLNVRSDTSIEQPESQSTNSSDPIDNQDAYTQALLKRDLGSDSGPWG